MGGGSLPKVNFNPFDSSLFTGKGTPWGPGDEDNIFKVNPNPLNSFLFTGKGTPWGPGDAKGDLNPFDNLIEPFVPKVDLDKIQSSLQPSENPEEIEKREALRRLEEQRKAERAKESEDFTSSFLRDYNRMGLRDSLIGLQNAQRRARGRTMFEPYLFGGSRAYR